MWLAISLPYVCAVVVMKPEAIDFLGKIDARFALEQGAILATTLTAAIAAFASVIPGHHRKIYLLPLVPLAVWLASLGEGCASDWLRLGEPAQNGSGHTRGIQWESSSGGSPD
jgi:hypothetical protein